jgi:ketosteroid isomerase-like protein
MFAAVPDPQVEISLAAIDAFSRRELDRSLEYFHSEVVWEVSPEMSPDAGTYRGHAGVRQFWEFWHTLFEGFALEIVDVEVLEDGRILVSALPQGTGSASGVAVSSRPFAQVMEVRDGLIVWVGLYGTRRRALRALGLAD